jgi:hypothetical protein
VYATVYVTCVKVSEHQGIASLTLDVYREILCPVSCLINKVCLNSES